MTWRKLRYAGWGLLLASAFGASCGAAFHTGPDDGEGGEPATSEAGASTGGVGGTSSSAGAGEAGEGGAPVGGAAGNGGAGPTCEQLEGKRLDGGDTCYVDVTGDISSTQGEAVMACVSLASQLGRPAHLLVLDDPAEQEFILGQFLQDFTNVSDAWLGLTCDEQAHPNIDDCYCKDCADTVLAQKQQSWSWLDGTSASFGWVNANPNAAARCAALAFNPTPDIKEPWGWVERPCEEASITPIEGNPHGYRTLCEVEF